MPDVTSDQPHLQGSERQSSPALAAVVIVAAALIFGAIAISTKVLEPMTVNGKASPAPGSSKPPSPATAPSGTPAPIAGRWSRSIRLGRHTRQATTAIAVNSSGEAIAAWSAPDGIRAARGNSHGFGKSVVIDQGQRPAVAIDARGDSYLVWTSSNGTTMSIHSPRGKRLNGSTASYLSSGGAQLGASVVATPVSGAVAAWRDSVAGGLVPLVATATAGKALGEGRAVADPKPLVNNFDSRVGLAAGPDGTAAVAWPSAAKGQKIGDYRLFASAGSTSGQGFDQAYQIAPDSTSDQADISVGPKGQVVAVWIRYDDENVPAGFPHRADPYIYYSYQGDNGFGEAGKGPIVAGNHFLFGPQAFIDARDKLVVVWTNNDLGRHAGPLYMSSRPDRGRFSAVEPVPSRSRGVVVKDAMLRDNGRGSALLAWEANSDSPTASFGLAAYNGKRFVQVASPNANPASNGLGIGNRDFAAGGRYGALIWQQRRGPIEAAIFKRRR